MKRRIITVLVTLAVILPLSLVVNAQDEYTQRFLDLYEKLNDPNNGYFSADGVPYHSVESLICEAPDYGHETTSEMFSYWIWLEVMNARITGDFSGVNEAWAKLEATSIPTTDLQPTAGSYNPGAPATYAAEHPEPTGYPSPLESSVPIGQDPISGELTSTYGNSYVYGMHWLFDLDNFYGYGNKGDGVSTPSYINTFQRGEQESVWETVPHPSWEDFTWGADDGTGFLSLFIAEDAAPAAQWRYTNAPDADARAVQAIYWAAEFAKEQGLDPASVLPMEQAKKMGDYLRLAMFDKYFKPMGVQDKMGPGATGYESAHYLMSWYYAWGGPLESQGWAWRIGCSHNHFGYQNPVAAYALSEVDELMPNSPNGARDWGTSLNRQLEFYQWLQSAEGAIAGGATNSWNGDYDPYPSGQATFYGMAYDDHPVYHDPGSNTWFGWQAWSMERVAEYYYISNDSRAKDVIDKWVAWAMGEVVLNADGSWEIPVEMSWTGQPNDWDPNNPQENTSLHVTVENHNQDVGIAGCLAKTFIYYAAATQRWATLDTEVRDMAKEILDRMWVYQDDLGIAIPETRGDYTRFFEQEVYVPDGWTGTMANGDVIEPGVSFLDIRSDYRNDPDFPALEAAYNAGEDYEVSYHRFWAQVDAALANAEYSRFFGEGSEPVDVTGVGIGPVTTTIEVGQTVQLTAEIEPSNATNKAVSWTSSNANIATVNSSGLVSGVDAGEVSITVTTADGGFTANSQIIVEEATTVYYDLTTSVSGSGSVSPESGTYAEGSVVTLTATADAGFQFVNWTGDANGSATSVTITMDADKSVIANFTEIVEGCASEIAISMPFSHNGVGEFCWVAAGDLNYINSWNMDVVEVNGQDFTNVWTNNPPAAPDGKIHIRYVASVPWAHFEINGVDGNPPVQFDLTTNAIGLGSVSPSSGTYDEGTLVTLTASPAAGYEFSSWSGDASGSSPTVTITMDANKEVTATFTQIPDPVDYNLVVNIVGQGTVEPNGGTFEEGTELTLLATPDQGYEFTGWSGDASGSALSVSITMDADKLVTATFTEVVDPVYYTLSTAVIGQGTISPSNGTYLEGTEVCITATPATGYEFAGWSGDANGNAQTVCLIMDANKNATAIFEEVIEPVYYTLTVETILGDIISQITDDYLEGTSVTLIAEPISGYVFVGWGGDANGTASSVSILMDADKFVTKTYENEGPVGCSNPVAQSIPFSQNGVGEYCWIVDEEPAYINSWNMALVEVNGADFTNTWASSYPASADGTFTIHYIGEFPWSHFEASQAKGAIENISADNSISVYPNPFDKMLNIDLTNAVGVYRIEVLTSLGQIIELFDENQLKTNLIQITPEGSGQLLILKIYRPEGVETLKVTQN